MSLAEDIVPAPAGLAAKLEALFTAPVALALDGPSAPPEGLWAVERAAMAQAVPAREREFAAGRRAARRAMAALDYRPEALPMGADRAPIWPDGLVGSISHGAGVCVAAVARRGAARSLGIDLEEAGAVGDDLLGEICTLAERAWVQAQPEPNRAILASLLFSAKEAAYKCQYPLSGKVLDFQALEITPDLDLGRIEARFTQAVGPFQAQDILFGRYVVTDGIVATGFEIAADR